MLLQLLNKDFCLKGGNSSPLQPNNFDKNNGIEFLGLIQPKFSQNNDEVEANLGSLINFVTPSSVDNIISLNKSNFENDNKTQPVQVAQIDPNDFSNEAEETLDSIVPVTTLTYHNDNLACCNIALPIQQPSLAILIPNKLEQHVTKNNFAYTAQSTPIVNNSNSKVEARKIFIDSKYSKQDEADEINKYDPILLRDNFNQPIPTIKGIEQKILKQTGSVDVEQDNHISPFVQDDQDSPAIISLPYLKTSNALAQYEKFPDVKKSIEALTHYNTPKFNVENLTIDPSINPVELEIKNNCNGHFTSAENKEKVLIENKYITASNIKNSSIPKNGTINHNSAYIKPIISTEVNLTAPKDLHHPTGHNLMPKLQTSSQAQSKPVINNINYESNVIVSFKQAQIQDQVKEGIPPVLQDISDRIIDYTLPETSSQNLLAQKILDIATPNKAKNQLHFKSDILANINEQIKFQLTKVHNNDHQIIKFTLSPAELGNIEIKFDRDNETGFTSINVLTELRTTLEIVHQISKDIELTLTENGFNSENCALNLSMQNKNSNEEAFIQDKANDSKKFYSQSNDNTSNPVNGVILLNNSDSINILV